MKDKLYIFCTYQNISQRYAPKLWYGIFTYIYYTSTSNTYTKIQNFYLETEKTLLRSVNITTVCELKNCLELCILTWTTIIAFLGMTIRYTMCDFHDLGLTENIKKKCFGWLHDYLKG